ncbi:MAG: TatD family hydrolase [Bdellovibrionales bacterium]
MYVDSHCHLDFEQFDKDRDAIVQRARAAGVERMVTISTSLKSFPKVLQIAETYEDVYCSIGLHPHDADKEGHLVTGHCLVEQLNHPKIVGIGETGLDYFYEYSSREGQQEAFRKHIRAAIASGVPLIIHTREAEADTIRLLEEERKGCEDRLRGVLHCFSSNRELAEYAIQIGFYISVSGMLTFKKSENIREIIQDVPKDRLLIETDSPYLAPIPYRGKTCEPAYVVHTAQKLAEVKETPVEEMAKITTENFYTLFDKVQRA